MNLTTSQGQLLAQFDECIYTAAAIRSADLPFPAGPTPLALHEATICPTAVDISDAEYASRYAGKVAVWLG
jgi:hypothetical protein